MGQWLAMVEINYLTQAKIEWISHFENILEVETKLWVKFSLLPRHGQFWRSNMNSLHWRSIELGFIVVGKVWGRLGLIACCYGEGVRGVKGGGEGKHV